MTDPDRATSTKNQQNSEPVFAFGPGHHLGSDGIYFEARDLLAPAADRIDRKRVLERYRLVLRLLNKTRLNRGEQPGETLLLSFI